MTLPGQFLLYTAPDGAVKVDVFFRDETVWLTQKALAELFGVQRPAITKHLGNIFATGELAEESVCSILEHTAGDGKTYSDFMFQLTPGEAENLKCQIGSPSGWGGRRRSLPYAFTEQGVAMLSGVLTSPRAVQVNVASMRAFVQLRQMLSSHAELARKLAELERRLEGHDEGIRSLFDAIRQLMARPKKSEREIGVHTLK